MSRLIGWIFYYRVRLKCCRIPKVFIALRRAINYEPEGPITCPAIGPRGRSSSRPMSWRFILSAYCLCVSFVSIMPPDDGREVIHFTNVFFYRTLNFPDRGVAPSKVYLQRLVPRLCTENWLRYFAFHSLIFKGAKSANLVSIFDRSPFWVARVS